MAAVRILQRFLHNDRRISFDTYRLVRQLESNGFTRGQSVAVMRTINAVLVDSTLALRGQTVSNSEIENEAYNFKRRVEALKGELAQLRFNEAGSLKAEVEEIHRNLESLNQKLAERVAGLKADVSMDLNNHKIEGRDVGTSLDLKIQDLQSKLTIRISDLKTRIETLKMETTRNIVWVAIGSLFFILAGEFLSPQLERKDRSTSSSSLALHPRPSRIADMKRNLPLSRKLNKILNTSIDDPQTLEALRSISDVMLDNNATSRRHLRGDLEKKGVELNRKFLKAFDGVAEKLDVLEQSIGAINECLVEMGTKLESANAKSENLIRRTADLKTKSGKALTKRAIVEQFLAKFTPTDREIAVLTSSSLALDSEFFDALSRLQIISENCKALLITDNQQAGLEIMEKMATYQEAAYEKLFRWAQSECRSFNKEIPEVTQAMRGAMNALKQRPALFQTIIDEISHIRQSAISRSFIEALTRGGPDGFPRPIELSAHDPLRYTGDILAWLHMASISERELYHGLFDMKGKDDHNDFTAQEKEIVFSLLDRSFDRTCRPLRVRLEQVLASQPGAITAYRITNVIKFYAISIRKVLGENSALSVTLTEIQNLAHEGFIASLKENAQRLLQSGEAPGTALAPPPSLHQSILQLKELMASYEGNLLDEDDRDDDFAEILTTCIDPLISLCTNAGAELPQLERAIFMLNCLTFIQSALAPFAFTAARVAEIETIVGQQMDTLVDVLYKGIINDSGLVPVLTAIDSLDGTTPLSRLVDQIKFADSMAAFDAFVGVIGFNVSSKLTRLISSQLARRALSGSCKAFLASYGRIYDQIMDPANKFEFPKTIMGRSVDEVRTLLDFDSD